MACQNSARLWINSLITAIHRQLILANQFASHLTISPRFAASCTCVYGALVPEAKTEFRLHYGNRSRINFAVPSQKAPFSCCSYVGFRW